MATMVGMQSDFTDAIKELIELEYDAAEAYLAAVGRLEKKEYKDKMAEFLEDHKRHINQLSEVLKTHNEKVPTSGGTGKNLLTVGKVMLGNLIGDKAILTAMNSNEMDTNTAYDRMHDRQDQWKDIELIIKKAREDEHRHKAWLEKSLKG